MAAPRDAGLLRLRAELGRDFDLREELGLELGEKGLSSLREFLELAPFLLLVPPEAAIARGHRRFGKMGLQDH